MKMALDGLKSALYGDFPFVTGSVKYGTVRVKKKKHFGNKARVRYDTVHIDLSKKLMFIKLWTYSGESPRRLETALVLIVLDFFVIAGSNCYLTGSEWFSAYYCTKYRKSSLSEFFYAEKSLSGENWAALSGRCIPAGGRISVLDVICGNVLILCSYLIPSYYIFATAVRELCAAISANFVHIYFQ